MNVRCRNAAAFVLSLWLTPLLVGQAAEVPSPSSPTDQKAAQTIAETLRQCGSLRHYNIDVNVRAGVAEVKGSVASPAQHEQVLRLIKVVPGVSGVVDHLSLLAPSPLILVQDSTAPTPLPPVPAAKPVPPATIPAPSTSANGLMPEPMPIFQAPMPSPYDLNPPRMPPYAWPTYAPYNNASRVAYPLAYPYEAWPFIGPCHPFPKAPLGWRSVKLEFEDGYWWFSRTATKYDWWHLRYW